MAIEKLMAEPFGVKFLDLGDLKVGGSKGSMLSINKSSEFLKPPPKAGKCEC
jgi:hypothetical protein